MQTAPLKTGLLLILVILGISGTALAQNPPAESTRTLYLVNHGWHAGIIVKRSDIPAGIWPEHEDFSTGEYLEIGWGDRDYYIEPDPHLGITLKAALWPTPSVLHIAAFSGPVTDYFKGREIIEIAVTKAGFEKLCRYFHKSYATDSEGRTVPLRPGLYGNSRFYLSRESYHLLKTCNVWTARALAAAGLPIAPEWTIRVESLMAKARQLGSPLQVEAGNQPPEK